MEQIRAEAEFQNGTDSRRTETEECKATIEGHEEILKSITMCMPVKGSLSI